MRSWLAITITLAAAGVSLAQGPSRVYAQARTPDKKDLDRAGVKMAWSLTLPMDGRRDGLAKIQLIPITIPSGAATRDLVLLVVQMQSGTLALYDGETGQKFWSVQPGNPYPPAVHDVAVDFDTVVVIRGQQMYGYDLFEMDEKKKPTGLKRDAKQRWSMRLPNMPTTGPASNGPRIVVCMNGNLLVGYEYGYTPPWKTRITYNEPYKVNRGVYEDYTKWTTPDPKISVTPSMTMALSMFGPNFGIQTDVREPAPPSPSLSVVANLTRPNELNSNSDMSSTPSLNAVDKISRLSEYSQKDAPPPKMEERWSDSLPFRVFQTPYVFQAVVMDPNSPAKGQVETRMIVVGSERDLRAQGFNGVKYAEVGHDIMRSNISAPVAQLDASFFVPTFDGTIYAFRADRGLVLWTSNIQGVPATKPAAVTPDVFVTTTEGRMFRLNIDDGSPPKPSDGLFGQDGGYSAVIVKQFLAASERTVFAIDPISQLLVMDRKRGTIRGRVDMAGYTFTYLNDVTDRVLLGSNDGKLICLHDPAQAAQKLYHPSIHRRFAQYGAAVEKPMDAGK
jgi:outer membrane protein assembly factor BamB